MTFSRIKILFGIINNAVIRLRPKKTGKSYLTHRKVDNFIFSVLVWTIKSDRDKSLLFSFQIENLHTYMNVIKYERERSAASDFFTFRFFQLDLYTFPISKLVYI